MIIPQRFRVGLVGLVGLVAVGAVAVGMVAVGLVGTVALDAQEKKAEKPKITLRSSPSLLFARNTVTITAEVREGDDDYEDFYCAAIEWDWGDGTRSEQKDDCPPYEAGKSEIRRRYTIQHTYNIDGAYEVYFRLKQRGQVVGQARTRVIVRPR